MEEIINYNQKGALLEELARIQVSREQKIRLFQVIEDIKYIVHSTYPDPESGDYLENRLAHYEGLHKNELLDISKGIKDRLRIKLEQHSIYNPDTINQVFIALYDLLTRTVNGRDLSDIVEYRKDSPIYADSMNAEIIEIVRWTNIYRELSTWVTESKRVIEGLNQNESSIATKQFNQLKKYSAEFIRSLRSLLRKNYNIQSSYESFIINRSWEGYKLAIEVIENTMLDCVTIAQQSSKIKSNGNEAITKFTNIIHLNSQYYFLQMGYEMLTNNSARSSIPNPKKFQVELLGIAFNPEKITYFSTMPNGRIVIDSSVKRLSPEVRQFYDGKRDKLT